MTGSNSINATTAVGNFGFLIEHDPIFLQLAQSAERAFSSDPNTTLVKLRQFAEAIAQDLAMRCSIEFDDKTNQADLLFRINRELRLESQIISLFHGLRKAGNQAVHQFKTEHKSALAGIRVARDIAIWYHRAFGEQGVDFRSGEFVIPQDPSKQLSELQTQIQLLKSQLIEHNEQLESNQQLTSLLEREKEEFAVLAEQMNAEARELAIQAKSHEQALAKQQAEFDNKLTKLQKQLAEQTEETLKAIKAQRKDVNKRTNTASSRFTLNEELTRILIDQQLTDAGWEADSQELTYQKGIRPEKGKNLAIAEWPTKHNGQGGRADYVLFCGLTPIAVVEAKKENTNVAGKIPQAERYSKGYKLISPQKGAWELENRTVAWADEEDGHYHIPFVYSCNGRPFNKQLAELSGTWFRDTRKTSNAKRPLQQFHSPDGLIDKLKRSREEAEKLLQQEGFDYLGLRDYQQKAIVAVESALEQDKTQCLLAMATGTGKTRTIIGLMYRFLKAERFKRILFLVDRTALGTQACDSFDEAKLEQNKTLSSIYNIAELGDMSSEAETRIQVATVQAMVKRIFMSDTPPSLDEFDCIIVDEAHRGYALDQKMTEGELANRDASQYLSSYRRVLDYFDAVRIGLTATPAKHTSEIFGKPIYTYSYREAVAEDWLIDHEPPIRYETLLSKNGIKFEKGETVSAINTQTGEVESADLEDELKFDVESFNRRVITKGFNDVICDQLVNELDPFGDEKTLIFCTTDLHADMVKTALDSAFNKMYGDDYNQAAVAKITGKSDKVSQLIRQYKNERYPNIAVTVDLLTTGIDVPTISHLVFLRRVKSRILYEQMMGRATRRCDEIGKTVFKVYDPVDLYSALEAINTMKPIVKDPNITLEQLVDELSDDAHLEQALNTPGEQTETSHANDVLNQLTQKVMRVMRKAVKKAESKPELKAKLDQLEGMWGVAPDKLHQHLHQIGPKQAAQFFKQHQGLINQLAEVRFLAGSDKMPVIYEGHDEFLSRQQSYGVHEKPADYLESFNTFIKDNINQSAALSVVVNRPKDLTREQLKEVKLLLDEAGYNEAHLQSAWRKNTNQDIAASIIGYIRQAAINEALIPFEQRVSNAMQRIYSEHNWTPNQRKWLERLAKQLIHEAVIDKSFVNLRFADHGGAKRFNSVLDDQLDTVLDELNEYLWQAG
ncbi:type I restriction-modification system endonuclease [Shewanella sp. D64]|uniref:type I restriction-modification system endonuclease n=1 Tax=unclassified Shewanella TaxID=196818 RepID=UPI0022BA5D23|nr:MULTISPECIES: type I restriction-modification system endonuclease [unclassified Shewanella]MEC4726794.1 type I restriction-modification system endonuclease [Shewanella sp. D64]MEC4739094.1 type I restriction-modification system endonuclease [Shewanella sp. E94]WBJ95950.1 type I restriction-modification system endonuclease [Shewanella sp. MTB7]